jgi:hypothetical protein
MGATVGADRHLADPGAAQRGKDGFDDGPVDHGPQCPRQLPRERALPELLTTGEYNSFHASMSLPSGITTAIERPNFVLCASLETPPTEAFSLGLRSRMSFKTFRDPAPPSSGRTLGARTYGLEPERTCATGDRTERLVPFV